MTTKFKAFLWHTAIFFLFTIWMNTVPEASEKQEETRKETLKVLDMLGDVMDGKAVY